MRRFQQFLLSTLTLLTLTPVLAEPMQCGQNLVSPGDTEAQVLELCGEPASRQGSTWIYQGQGELPKHVTFGNGVIMFIKDGDQSGVENTSPLGDHL